jgi:putative hemolysin
MHDPTPALLRHFERPLLRPEIRPASRPGAVLVRCANSEEEIRAAQRLRYNVFANEYGAHLHTPVPGLDIDPYDAWCDHLIALDEASGDVVGCYRMMPLASAARLGSSYIAEEFFITRLAGLAGELVEFGRSCVHPQWRNSLVLLALWGGLARYMHERGLRYAVGCASVSLADGGANAQATWQSFGGLGAINALHEVFPINRYPARDQAGDISANGIVPPLIGGYVKMGARLIGCPAWDPEFNTADFPLMLDLAAIPNKYSRHFGIGR